MKKNHLLRFVASAVLTAVLFASCGTAEEYVLLNDIQAPSKYSPPQRHDLRIKKGDELQIVVAHRVPKVIEAFNQKISTVDSVSRLNSYTVSSDGYISMPVFDTVYVVGKTCRELEKYLVARMEEEGVAYGASVSVKILNFKVTVIGESSTGVFEFEEGATLFDLLAKSNMLRGTGSGANNIRRDKVLIMRDCDSVVRSEFINFLTTDVMYSPYFYLQQNDVFYVYPSTDVIRRSNQVFDFWWDRASILTSTLSLGTTLWLLILRLRDN